MNLSVEQCGNKLAVHGSSKMVVRVIYKTIVPIIKVNVHSIFKTRQDKTTLFNQGSPISCKAGILRGPGVR